MTVVAGIAAAALLAAALVRRMRRRGQHATACAAAGALCVANPFALDAVALGHGQELLAGALCAGAALAALRPRTGAAATGLGLALASAQWAAVAVLPVLAAARGRRLRLVVLAVGVAALATGAVLALGGSALGGDLAWPALLAVPLTALWWSSPRRTPDDALALLALLFLLACVLDAGRQTYEHVPFLLALVAWEGLTRRGLPIASLVSALAIWAAPGDLYLLAALPAAAWLAARLFVPARGLVRVRAWPAPARRTPLTH
jgi:hypothetical protein